MDLKDMEIEDSSKKSDLKLRDRYLLERDRIKNQLGELPQILEALGVNQRRACQLLLVDPSAWTRWNKTEAPPHIYQALKWLVMLKKTNPNMFGSTDIETRIDSVQSSTQNKFKELERNIASLERALAYQPVATSNSNENTQINELFQAQQERLQKRISELESEVKRLSENQTKPKTASAQNKKPKRKKLRLKPKTKLKPAKLKIRKKKKSTPKKKAYKKQNHPKPRSKKRSPKGQRQKPT